MKIFGLLLAVLAAALLPAQTFRARREPIPPRPAVTAEEIAAAPQEVRLAYEVWRRPPAIELYDLEADPYELRNLAGKDAYAKVESRLLARLRQWQRETNDPFAKPELLAKYEAETTRVS